MYAGSGRAGNDRWTFARELAVRFEHREDAESRGFVELDAAPAEWHVEPMEERVTA